MFSQLQPAFRILLVVIVVLAIMVVTLSLFGCALTPYNRAAASYGPTDYGLATPPAEGADEVKNGM